MISAQLPAQGLVLQREARCVAAVTLRPRLGKGVGIQN